MRLFEQKKVIWTVKLQTDSLSWDSVFAGNGIVTVTSVFIWTKGAKNATNRSRIDMHIKG
jgi:hypothetical protein